MGTGFAMLFALIFLGNYLSEATGQGAFMGVGIILGFVGMICAWYILPRVAPWTATASTTHSGQRVHKPSRPPIPQDVKRTVYARDGGACVQCGSSQQIEFDHIIPYSKGGADSVNNLQILCRRCNRSKGANI
jgi:5-methylcytosine-specific restriction endonuclease McrA